MAAILAFLKAVPELVQIASQALKAWEAHLEKKAIEEREEIISRQRRLSLEIMQAQTSEDRAALVRRLSELERRIKPK